MKLYTAGNLPDSGQGEVDDMLLSQAKNRLTFVWSAFRYFLMIQTPLPNRLVSMLLVVAIVAMFAIGHLWWGLALLITLVLRYGSVVAEMNRLYNSERNTGVMQLLTWEGLQEVLEYENSDYESSEYVRVNLTPWTEVDSIAVYSNFMVIITGSGEEQTVNLAWSTDMDRASMTALTFWSRALEAEKRGKDAVRLEHYTEKELDEVLEFIEDVFDKVGYILHEKIFTDVHIDIAVIPPSPDRDYLTLCTVGAGAHRMNVPDKIRLESQVPERYELLIYLPADWDLSEKGMEDERNYWPIRLLKNMARMPLINDTWMMWGHTSSNPDNEPFAPGCPFVGTILTCPEPDFYEGYRLALTTAKTMEFLQVFPLTSAELEYVLECASDADRSEPPLSRMLSHFGMSPDCWKMEFLSRFAATPANKQ